MEPQNDLRAQWGAKLMQASEIHQRTVPTATKINGPSFPSPDHVDHAAPKRYVCSIGKGIANCEIINRYNRPFSGRIVESKFIRPLSRPARTPLSGRTDQPIAGTSQRKQFNAIKSTIETTVPSCLSSSNICPQIEG